MTPETTEPALLHPGACPSCGRSAESAPTGEHRQQAVRRLRTIRARSRFLAAGLLYFTVLLILLLLGRRFASPLHGLLAAQGAEAILALAFLAVCRRHVVPSLRLPGDQRGSLVLATAFGVASFVIVFFWTLLLGEVTGIRIPRATRVFEEEGYGTVAMVLGIAVVPALVEEVLFRGIVFGMLRPVAGRVETIVVTTVAFAILHLSPMSLPHLLLLGAIFGLIREVTGSVVPAMAAHLVHNALVVAFERCFGLS